MSALAVMSALAHARRPSPTFFGRWRELYGS
jgi:hypothetical protein